MSDEPLLGRRELNKQHTRERLVGALRELFGETGRFASVEEIVERAGVSRATFFNYYRSKDELLAAVYAELIVGLDQLVAGLVSSELTTRERIVAVFADFAENCEREPELLLPLTAELDRLATQEQSIERARGLTEMMQLILVPGVERGEVRTDLTPEFLGRMVASVYVSTVRHGWRDGGSVTFAEDFLRAGRFVAEALEPRPSSE